MNDCIRCGEMSAVDVERELCSHCYWAFRAEVEAGFQQLREYLRAWARFNDWCRDHERVAV